MGNTFNDGTYEVGDIVNGAQWDGRRWVPLPETNKRNQRTARIIGAVVIAAVAGFILLGVIANLNKGEVVPSTEQLSRSAYSECKYAVEGYLKAPSTADFPWYDPSYVSASGNKYTVSAYVDAQNSFGAMVRSVWTCTAYYSKGNWSTEDVQVFG